MPKCFYGIGTQAPEGAQEDPHRREAIQVQLGGVQREVCQVGHPDQALQEAHGGEAISVPPLRQVILPERDHEEAHENTLNMTLGKGNLDHLR